MDRLVTPLFVAAGVLIGLAADRLINMLWIGRPLDSYVMRAWVYQLCLAAGIALLIVAAAIRRRR